MLSTLKFIISHPLNKQQKFKAIKRWFRWQIDSRFARGPLVVPFVNGTKLIVKTGMTGATGNIYCGLHEFETMAFCLHFLRPKDLVCDIGANIGSYSVLSASIKAQCLAFEPIPSTYQHLLNNIAINQFENLVHPYNMALGDRKDFIYMTKSQDTTNHVVLNQRTIDSGNIVNVPVNKLDDVLGDLKPILLKIDVEGYEENVLAGAHQNLLNDSLIAVILEINTSTIHQKMLNLNFTSYRYHPFEKRLEKLTSTNPDSANTIYLKNNKSVGERLKSAMPFEILGQTVGRN